jgi:LPXTG-motif cell wall-anchored protein
MAVLLQFALFQNDAMSTAEKTGENIIVIFFVVGIVIGAIVGWITARRFKDCPHCNRLILKDAPVCNRCYRGLRPHEAAAKAP